MYENRAMKPDEIVLKWEGQGMKENTRGGESNQDTLYVYIYKYHN
jgi:hypothetical protein